MRWALVAIAACTPRAPATPARSPEAGVTLSIFQAPTGASFAMIDDRRWVTIAGTELVLERIDPTAALSSLAIEPLAGAALAIGRCARDRIVAVPTAVDALAAFGREQARIASAGEREGASADAEPDPDAADRSGTRTIASSVVRCAVTAAPGRYLVRVGYVTSSLRYRVQHDVTIRAATSASFESRYLVVAPTWGGVAELRLYEGRPGELRPPRLVAHGPAVLDGSTAILTVPIVERAVRLRWIYDGVRADPTTAVWVWLEVDHLALPSGPIRAHVELPGEQPREIVVPAGRRDPAREALRAPLWVDPQLRGQRTLEIVPETRIRDRVQLAVANSGSEPRSVWLEEPLRDLRERKIVRAWPTTPAIAHDRAQLEVIARPGEIVRVAFTVAYAR